jgi:hypothetical protein
VEHPKDFKVSLSPRVEGDPDVDPVGGDRLRTTWTYRRLFFNSDAIFVEWTPADGASPAAAETSKVLKDKGQGEQKPIAPPNAPA